MNALSTKPLSAIAVLVTLGLTLLPANLANAAGEDDVTWTVRTAANDFGAERSSYSYTVNPGSTLEDALVIANHGTEPLDLGVYAADGYTTDSGQFDLVVGGAKSVSVGAWIQGETEHVTVGPGETVEFPFTVSVPDDATPGDYAGGIVTSLVQPDSDGINVDRRLGIRIALRVGGDLKPSLAIENQHLDWSGGLNPFAGGNATLTYTIHNTGNAVLSAVQTAIVAGPFGLLPAAAGVIEDPPQLLPGESWDVVVPIHGVAASVWLSGTATVTPVVVDASGSTTALEPIDATATGWAVPWMLLLLLVVVAGLAFLGFRLVRVLRARQQAREDARVKEAVELALAEKKAAKSARTAKA